jgi:hypothetical protein
MNKPLLLRGLVAAMSGSREKIIEETDITNSTEGATSYGENNYECAGVICTDGNQSAKGIRTGKDTGVPDNTNRSKNSDSD